MEVPDGAAHDAAPSKALLDLRRLVDYYPGSSAQPAEGAALSNAFVPVSDLSRLHFCAAVVKADKVLEKACKVVAACAKKAASAHKKASVAALKYDNQDKKAAKKAATATAELKKAPRKAPKAKAKRPLKSPLQSPRRLPEPPHSPPKPATAEKERRKSAAVNQTSPGFYLLFT